MIATLVAFAVGAAVGWPLGHLIGWRRFGWRLDEVSDAGPAVFNWRIFAGPVVYERWLSSR